MVIAQENLIKEGENELTKGNIMTDFRKNLRKKILTKMGSK